MRQAAKRGVIYILIAILFYVHLRVNVAAILDLLGSNVYSWFTKLLHISHIIVSIFSGVIIVTVNIKKWRTYWMCRSNKGNFFPMTLEISFWNKNLTETKNCAFMFDKSKNIRGFVYILLVILCFAYLKVKVTKYRILSERFEFSTPKFCKNKWIAKYTLKYRANFNVPYFSPD